MPVDSTAFRSVMGRFATGVTVATTYQASRRLGITVNAFASVSLDPPLVLFCLERASRVHQAFLDSGIFAVNILASDQETISNCFASNSDFRHDEFCGVHSHVAATGAPILEDCLGFVDCRLVNVFDGGDHSILVGLVEAIGARDGDPLLYHRSHYVDLRETRT